MQTSFLAMTICNYQAKNILNIIGTDFHKKETKGHQAIRTLQKYNDDFLHKLLHKKYYNYN